MTDDFHSDFLTSTQRQVVRGMSLRINLARDNTIASDEDNHDGGIAAKSEPRKSWAMTVNGRKQRAYIVPAMTVSLTFALVRLGRDKTNIAQDTMIVIVLAVMLVRASTIMTGTRSNIMMRPAATKSAIDPTTPVGSM